MSEPFDGADMPFLREPQAAPTEPTTAAGPVHDRCGYLLACPCWTDGANAGRREAEARQPSPGLREALDVLKRKPWYEDAYWDSKDVIDALAADTASQPEPLDVERLAEAVRRTSLQHYRPEASLTYAKALAAAYATLDASHAVNDVPGPSDTENPNTPEPGDQV